VEQLGGWSWTEGVEALRSWRSTCSRSTGSHASTGTDVQQARGDRLLGHGADGVLEDLALSAGHPRIMKHSPTPCAPNCQMGAHESEGSSDLGWESRMSTSSLQGICSFGYGR
jgi:hypothetical protein